MTDRRLLALVRRELARWLLEPLPADRPARRRWLATGDVLWQAMRAARHPARYARTRRRRAARG